MTPLPLEPLLINADNIFHLIKPSSLQINVSLQNESLLSLCCGESVVLMMLLCFRRSPAFNLLKSEEVGTPKASAVLLIVDLIVKGISGIKSI